MVEHFITGIRVLVILVVRVIVLHFFKAKPEPLLPSWVPHNAQAGTGLHTAERSADGAWPGPAFPGTLLRGPSTLAWSGSLYYEKFRRHEMLSLEAPDSWDCADRQERPQLPT